MNQLNCNSIAMECTSADEQQRPHQTDTQDRGRLGACAICLEEFGMPGGSTGDSIISTPCSHKFHTSCISRWIAICPNCPICRTSFNDDATASGGDDQEWEQLRVGGQARATSAPARLRAQPKFRRGQAVRYNAEKRAEFFNYVRNNPGSRMPTVPLRIWADPQWSAAHTTWIYCYEYDWTSEGSALEEDLESLT